MGYLRSLAVAFSTYSKIPMPQFPFDVRNLRLSLCFFPLVGAVVGAAFVAVRALAQALAMGALLTGALCCVVPLLVTGGIHMDGFIDTVDALSSHQPREKKLAILSDPHVGAFGVMGCVLYLIVQLGIFAESLDARACTVVAASFVLSRALSGLLLLALPAAKSTGLLHTFKDGAAKGVVRIWLIAEIALAAAAMIWIDPLRGGFALIAAAGVALCNIAMARRQFGGVTGDLAGFFLQMCELLMALAVVLV